MSKAALEGDSARALAMEGSGLPKRGELLFKECLVSNPCGADLHNIMQITVRPLTGSDWTEGNHEGAWR